VNLKIEDLELEALNGGPHFKFTPAFSFFVSCSSEKEIQEKWKALSQGGSVRMALDKYPWAEKYAWTSDRFGVEWQLILSPRKQKVAPSLLFVDALFGRGEEAIQFYTSLFPRSKIESLARDESTNSVLHCTFTLNGQGFALAEGQGRHGFVFNESTSLVLSCDDQAEIDSYWEKLSQGGAPGRCGWLKDKYGVSWQIVPSAYFDDQMSDPEKSDKIMQAILTMGKIEIEGIRRALK
jgi:predicted 3-demethylubiquinone-9 3-methyltransferase (glyoxalase superfamily)